ncbi:MAG: hypothetical protein IKZ50_05280 [Bacteroidales bacterium]|nr:hypothetical protein [Bacteroidales bacterium]
MKKEPTNRKTIIVLFIFTFLIDPLIIFVIYSLFHWGIEYRFSKNYVLCDDGEIFYIDNNKEKTYYNVIPYGVKKYNSNRRWIIAQTRTGFIYSRDSSQINEPNIKNLTLRFDAYWIIDKSIPINTSDSTNYCLLYTSSYPPYDIISHSLIGPLSLEEFNRIKGELEIDLELTKTR